MVIEKKDLSEAVELFQKFSARYSEDLELVKICEDYAEYVEDGEEEKLDDIKISLERLKSMRSSGGLGSTDLWFKDRRQNIINLLQLA